MWSSKVVHEDLDLALLQLKGEVKARQKTRRAGVLKMQIGFRETFGSSRAHSATRVHFRMLKKQMHFAVFGMQMHPEA